MGVVFLVHEKSLLLKILQGISTVGNGFIHGLSNLSRKFINPIIDRGDHNTHGLQRRNLLAPPRDFLNPGNNFPYE